MLAGGELTILAGKLTELKQRLLKSGESLLSQLVGQGWVCAPPEAPSS